MTLARFQAQNHPQQVAKRGPDDTADDRGTLPEFIADLEARYGEPFTLDVAASATNAKAPTYYDRAADGLTRPWPGNVWCNPPFSNLHGWVSKAWHEWETGTARRITMLLPANRTEQKWWQDLVEPHRDGRGGGSLKVEFLPGRMRFIRPNAVIDPRGDRPPFGCCLAIWWTTVSPRCRVVRGG